MLLQVCTRLHKLRTVPEVASAVYNAVNLMKILLSCNTQCKTEDRQPYLAKSTIIFIIYVTKHDQTN